MYKPIIASLFVLSAMCRYASAFAPSLAKLHRHHLRMQTSEQTRTENEGKNEKKGETDQELQTDAPAQDDVDGIFKDINGIGTLDEAEIMYNIGNEIGVKEFVNIINEKDRSIPHEEIFDVSALIEQLIGKAFDTVEDAALMFRRATAETDNLLRQDELDADVLSEWNDPKQAHKPRILVIGSGWASHAFIKCIDTEKSRVLVVSPSNYFVFTPMLASSSVGTTEIRSIVESTRDANPTVKYLEGKGLDINAEAKTMTVKLGEGNIIDDGPDDKDQAVIEIPYDVIVYSAGVGPISSSKRTEGLSKENVHFLKTVDDARGLRTAVITLLEKASRPGLSDDERRKLLTFVVVGGGPTGVEYCGELKDFLNDVTGKEEKKNKSVVKRKTAPFAPLAKYTNVKLLQGASDLLPMFDQDLRDSAKEGLLRSGVDVRTNTRVARIEGKDRIVTLNPDGSDETIDCGIIVWAAGTMPVQLTEKLIHNLDRACEKKCLDVTPGSLSKFGRIPVDQWQRVLGAPPGSMIAIGDASGTVRETSDQLLPQTAQVSL